MHLLIQKGNRMNKPFALIALGACVLNLGACDKTPTMPPTPTVNATVPTESAATAVSVTDPSLPSAASVFPANGTQADSTPGRTDGTRNPAQEPTQATGMPMPGQNNDHSAPLGPAKRASSPQ
jgi:hypothetical protein